MMKKHLLSSCLLVAVLLAGTSLGWAVQKSPAMRKFFARAEAVASYYLTPGSLNRPFTATQAREKASELSQGETSGESYYVTGIVSYVKYPFTAEHGTAVFNISEDGSRTNEFQVYAAYYLGNRPWVDGDIQIQVGDSVTVYGQMANYQGTLEMADKKCYLYSLNGYTGTVEEPQVEIAAPEWVEPECTYESVEPVDGGVYFLYNVGAEQFLGAGNDWGTHVVTSPLSDDNPAHFWNEKVGLGSGSTYILPVIVKQVDNGWTIEHMGSQRLGCYLTSEDGNCWIDGDGSRAAIFTFSSVGDDIYRISAINEPNAFLGVLDEDAVNNVYTNVDEDGWVDWYFLSTNYLQVQNYQLRQSLYELLLEAQHHNVDYQEALALYNDVNATFVQLETATSKLRSLVNSSAWEGSTEEDPVEITNDVLTNPDFSAGNINGWTCTFKKGETATNVGYQSANYVSTGNPLTGAAVNEDGESAFLNRFIEAWSQSSFNNGVVGDGELSQTVYGLPSGEYMLTCDAIAVDQYQGNNPVSGVEIFIATQSGLEATQEIATGNSDPEHFSVRFISDGSDALTFGLRTRSATANWIAADNFRIYFLGSNVSVGAAYLKSMLSNTFLPDSMGHCNTALKETYQSARATALEMVDDENADSDACMAQAETLKTAYEALKASIAEYATVPALYAQCQQLIDEVEATGNQKLIDELTAFGQDFYTAYEAGTLTSEAIANLMTNVKSIIRDTLIQNMKAGDDLTLLIANHDFSQEGFGWLHTLAEYEAPKTLESWTSPTIDHGRSTEKVYTFETTAGMYLYFNYQVSSESGCDYLTVYLDDNQLINISGEDAGSFSRVINAGMHTLRAVYSKDGSVNNGTDNGTLSHISYGIPQSDMPTVNYGYGVAEVYHNPFDFYQILPGMPAGAYRLTCTAFNRIDGGTRTAKLYGGISETRLKLITEEGSSYALLGDTQEMDGNGNAITSSTGIWPYDSKSTAVTGAEGLLRFVPNSMQGANTYFQTLNAITEQPYYTASVIVVLPEVGDLRIGVKSESSTEWTIWDNFRLEYAGDHTTLLSDAIEQLRPYLADSLHYNGNLRHRADSLMSVAEAGISEAAEAYTVSANIGNLVDLIKASIEKYTILADAMQVVTDKIANTSNLDETIAADATTLLTAASEAYAVGSYADVDAISVAEQLIYYSKRLQGGVLYIDMARAGELGDLVLDIVENFTDVISIYVTGPMNADDINNVKRMTNLKNLDLSEAELSSIASSAFQNNDKLQTVRLPKVLTSLEYQAFYDCDSLISVTIGGSLSSIGGSVFSDCNALEEVIFEDGTTSVGPYMFSGCDKLTKVTFSTTLTTIGQYAFQNCYRLTDFTLPQNLTTIGNCAFYRNELGVWKGDHWDETLGRWVNDYDNYPSVTSLTMPSTLTSIGQYAFYNQGELASVTFNEGLTSIGQYAFSGTNVTTVTLPSTLTSVGNYAFATASEFTSMSLTPPTASNDIAEAYGTLYVPSPVVKTYKQTNYWSKFNIVGINVMPSDIEVRKALRLELNDSTLADYKANVTIYGTSNSYSSTGTPSTLGALEVRNNSTLSASLLTINWNPQQNNYYRYNWSSNTYVPQHATLITNGTMRADSINVRMKLSDGRWNFISLPFDVRVGDIVCENPGTNWVIRRYDGARRAAADMDNTWVNMGVDDILEAGKGYIMHCSYSGSNSWSYSCQFRFPALNTVNKNLIFAKGDRTLALSEYESEFAHNRSWNLIGNPFAAYIPISAMDFTSPVTVWKGTGYAAYSPLDDDYILTPGEAFFVQRPVEKSTITFSGAERMNWYEASGRSQNNEEYWVKAQLPAQTNGRSVFNLTLSDGERSDRARIVLNEKALMGYEMDRDASKFMSMDATAPMLYTTFGGVDYAINERPLSDGTVNLVAHFGQTGTYTIALSTRAAGTVLLEDTQTGVITDLTSAETYSFEAEAGTTSTRFIIHFDNATAIKSVNADVLSGADIFTLDGRRVNHAANGIFIVRKGQSVRKMQVK